MSKMKQPSNKIILGVVLVIIVFVLFSRLNTMNVSNIQDTFDKAEIVEFRSPYEGEIIHTSTYQFVIIVYPTKMIGLYVDEWYFYLQTPMEEKLVKYNDQFESTSSFTITEMLYLETEGDYTIVISLNCYYEDVFYVFNSTRNFQYGR